jgi:hypothetical protein
MPLRSLKKEARTRSLKCYLEATKAENAIKQFEEAAIENALGPKH